jgi:hypothetical protein
VRPVIPIKGKGHYDRDHRRRRQGQRPGQDDHRALLIRSLVEQGLKPVLAIDADQRAT